MSSVSASGAVFHGPVASASTAVARAAATRARGRDGATRGEDAREATARARAGTVDIVVVAARRRGPSSRVPSRVSTPRRRSSMNDATSSQSVDDRRRDRAPWG